MRKEDLKTGMILQQDDGEKWLVLDNTNNEHKSALVFINDGGTGWLYGKDFTDTMEHTGYGNKVITSIHELKVNFRHFGSFDMSHYKTVWEREESKKEITVRELESKLGYKIKIVGEK